MNRRYVRVAVNVNGGWWPEHDYTYGKSRPELRPVVAATCKGCGTVLTAVPTGRKRKYCSASCRNRRKYPRTLVRTTGYAPKG